MRLKHIKGSEEAVASSPFVVQDPAAHKGHWDTFFGGPKCPLHIEAGMGKGQFLTGLAQQNPGINYLGIELYSSVLLQAVKKQEQLQLPNLFFLSVNAKDVCDYFAPGEVDRLYLNFSDPWPKDRHAKRRLTSPPFLFLWQSILAPGARLEFKTDNRPLFDFSLESVRECGWTLQAFTYDLHNDPVLNEGNIMTEYEEKFSAKGNPIGKLIALPPR